MKEQTIKLLGYIGTALILVMPYTLAYNYSIFLIFAILGNLLLLPQVYIAKQYNLVALNIIGGLGYIINLITNLFP